MRIQTFEYSNVWIIYYFCNIIILIGWGNSAPPHLKKGGIIMKFYIITIYVNRVGLGSDTMLLKKLYTDKTVAEAAVFKLNELFETSWANAEEVLRDDFGINASSAEAELNEISTSDNEVDKFIEAILFE